MAQEKKSFNWKEIPQKEKVYLGVIVVLVIACAALSWMVFETKTTVQEITLFNEGLESDKDALNQELDEMLEKYDALETDNVELQEDIIEQKEQIEKLKDEIEKNKGNVRLIAKYKKEVGTLRTIMQGYVVTIDSLNTLNQNLRIENTDIKEKLSTSRKEYQRLSDEASNLEGIVKKASKLQARGITFEGIRLRNSGKQAETSRAGRVEIFKVCFTLSANETTKPGAKTLFVEVVGPDGNVVMAQQNPDSKGVPAVYSSSREISYENQEMDVCVYANLNGSEAKEGDYAVKIYEAGVLIGEASTSFK